MAKAPRSTAKATTGVAKKTLTQVNRLRTFHLEEVVYDTNTNGKEFLKGVKEGAVYANIADMKPGIYTVVELIYDGETPGPLALNKPRNEELLTFMNEEFGKYSNLPKEILMERWGMKY